MHLTGCIGAATGRLARKVAFPGLGPIDGFEDHSAPEHFGFEISRVLLPLRGLPNTESGFLAETAERIVRRERTADALVHHGEAVVRERRIIHRTPPHEKAAGFDICDGLPDALTVPTRRSGIP